MRWPLSSLQLFCSRLVLSAILRIAASQPQPNPSEKPITRGRMPPITILLSQAKMSKSPVIYHQILPGASPLPSKSCSSDVAWWSNSCLSSSWPKDHTYKPPHKTILSPFKMQITKEISSGKTGGPRGKVCSLMLALDKSVSRRKLCDWQNALSTDWLSGGVGQCPARLPRFPNITKYHDHRRCSKCSFYHFDVG